MKIRDRDMALVVEFIKREAMDYGNKDPQWTQELFDKIIDNLKRYKGKADLLVINSYGNAGLLSRSLTITPDPWDIEGIVIINLCTCGSAECWGTIHFPDGKVIGKNGVEPL